MEGGGAASSVADCQYCASWPLGVGVMGRLVSGYSLPPPTPPTISRILDHMALPREVAQLDSRGPGPRAAGEQVTDANVFLSAVKCDLLTAHAEPAVMHVMSFNITVADRIRYDTPSIGYDTIPIR